MLVRLAKARDRESCLSWVMHVYARITKARRRNSWARPKTLGLFIEAMTEYLFMVLILQYTLGLMRP